MMGTNYYAVTCKHGHVGTRQYVPITFAIAAENSIDACDKAKQMPGVKHSAPVLACRQITQSDYFKMREQSAYERSNMK